MYEKIAVQLSKEARIDIVEIMDYYKKVDISLAEKL